MVMKERYILETDVKLTEKGNIWYAYFDVGHKVVVTGAVQGVSDLIRVMSRFHYGDEAIEPIERVIDALEKYDENILSSEQALMTDLSLDRNMRFKKHRAGVKIDKGYWVGDNQPLLLYFHNEDPQGKRGDYWDEIKDCFQEILGLVD